jgi:hypothetical protein
MIVVFLLLAASSFTVTNSSYTGPVRRPAKARVDRQEAIRYA